MLAAACACQSWRGSRPGSAGRTRQRADSSSCPPRSVLTPRAAHTGSQAANTLSSTAQHAIRDLQAARMGVQAAARGMQAPPTTVRDTAHAVLQDWLDIDFAISEGVDFIAVSFVKSADVIHNLRSYVSARAERKLEIIAKLESYDSVPNVQDIVAAADCVMVARGDLGAASIPGLESAQLQTAVKQALGQAGMEHLMHWALAGPQGQLLWVLQSRPGSDCWPAAAAALSLRC